MHPYLSYTLSRLQHEVNDERYHGLQFTSSLRVIICLLTNICNAMPLDILGEAEHGHMTVGGMMCHPILAQISPPALSGITLLSVTELAGRWLYSSPLEALVVVVVTVTDTTVISY